MAIGIQTRKYIYLCYPTSSCVTCKSGEWGSVHQSASTLDKYKWCYQAGCPKQSPSQQCTSSERDWDIQP